MSRIADPWYRTTAIDERIRVITEPHVHPIFSANMHLVLGSDADLLIDSGMGVAPLRPVVDALRPDPARPLICLSTRTHVDQISAVDEFDIRLVHPLEADTLAAPPDYSLRSADVHPDLVAPFIASGYPPLWPWLIDAVPDAKYEPGNYLLRGAAPIGTVTESDVIDLGDWRAR